MRPQNLYVVGSKAITKAAAANFIAEQLFSGREYRAAYKRIHSKISEAQARGAIPKQRLISADIFFGWAIQQKGWGSLCNIPGLPISTAITVRGVVGEGNVGFSSPLDLPSDAERLKALCLAALRQLETATRENAALKKELTDIKEGKAALRLKMQESGKRGGRGNEK